jgi:uncharacterized peroxidase-related enzyme
VNHHGAGLRTLTDDAELPRRIALDPDGAELDPADRAMLDYALKVTRTPARVRPEDVEVLRSHGFDDAAIHDICQVTAYYAFVNRMADGLGVEVEEWWGDPDSPDYEAWVVSPEEFSHPE